MISHDNYTWIADGCGKDFELNDPKNYGSHRWLSLLPLSHVSAQLTDLVLAVRFGVNIFFTDPSVLQGNLVRFLQICKPYKNEYLEHFLCVFLEFGKKLNKEYLL
jgi:long-chain-fatty-acid--CoA ligase ACSBG